MNDLLKSVMILLAVFLGLVITYSRRSMSEGEKQGDPNALSWLLPFALIGLFVSGALCYMSMTGAIP